MMSNLIISLLLVGLTLQQIACQDDLRSGVNDKSSGEGARTIYGAKPLSPHRMMHFGKRPENVLAPIIQTSGVYDPLQQQQQQFVALRPQPRLWQDRYPQLLSIKLESGQTLQALPEGAFETIPNEQVGSGNILYTVGGHPFDAGYILDEVQQQKLAQQLVGSQAAAFDKVKLMRMMKLSDDSGNSEQEANNNEANPQTNSNNNEALPDSQQNDQAINVSSRSVRGNQLNLSKAYISSLLYGRQGQGLQGFGSYNKKAEPKNNLFMHFGKK